MCCSRTLIAARPAVAGHRLRTTRVPDPRRNDDAILAATGDDLDELIGFVAAEASNEPSRSRRQQLDDAFDALSTAAPTRDG